MMFRMHWRGLFLAGGGVIALAILAIYVVLSGPSVQAEGSAGPTVQQVALTLPDPSQVVEELGLELDATPLRESETWVRPQKMIVRGFGPLNAAFMESRVEGVEFVTAMNEAEAMDHIEDADAVIGFCSAALIEKAERLQWIHMPSAGVESCVAIPDVRSGKFIVTNMQKVSSAPIAEHVMSLILTFSRGLAPYWTAQSEAKWAPPPLGAPGVWELKDKTILVVGLGGIGRQVAQRANAMGMRVVATRNSSREGPDYVDYVGLSDELLTLAADARVVVNALPLTPQTTNLFDAAFFDTMPSDAYFINVGRGKSVVTEDLIAALEANKIAGAGLDVTEPEPLPRKHPLWRAPNVLITPHVAAASDVTLPRYITVVAENAKRFANGDALYSVVDVEQGY